MAGIPNELYLPLSFQGQPEDSANSQGLGAQSQELLGQEQSKEEGLLGLCHGGRRALCPETIGLAVLSRVHTSHLGFQLVRLVNNPQVYFSPAFIPLYACVVLYLLQSSSVESVPQTLVLYALLQVLPFASSPECTKGVWGINE